MKRIFTLACILAAASLAVADTVTLTDGSALKGQVTELSDGSYKVQTAAGTLVVAADKVQSVVRDSAAGTDGMTDYERKVYAKRAAAGNDDGIPHAKLINDQQISLGMGYAFLNSDILEKPKNADGTNKYAKDDLNGLSLLLQLNAAPNQTLGFEEWVGYTIGTSGKLSRLDIGVNPRIQTPLDLRNGNFIIPHFSLGPTVSGVFMDDRSDWGVGGNVAVGIDFQVSHMIMTLQGRYMMVWDTASGFDKDYRNISAFMPTVNVGYAF